MIDDKRKPDDSEQSKRFIDTAREREADETEEGADKAFKKVAPPPGQDENIGTNPNECSVSMISASSRMKPSVLMRSKKCLK